jgi:N-sulfoglucosamine sulfohydrolase
MNEYENRSSDWLDPNWRKTMIKRLVWTGMLMALGALAAQPNFLIITADDMNWDSVGCYGCPLKDVTPGIDQLAKQGIRFEHAHVASTACYPSRSAISTGRRGHRSGGEGFFYLRHPDVPTVQQLLHDEGYRVGILGKLAHSTPYEHTPWDMAKEMGRDTNEFEKETAAFVDASVAAGKPFYLIVNSHDPHRPYYKIDKELTGAGDEPSRIYTPEEIPVHPTVPDHPAVRHEQAEYFSSVRRFDDVVKRTIKVIEDRKLSKNTMIVLLSDHGMAVPSAKSNCYVQSTRTPFIVRWDGTVSPGQVDTKHMVSSMDILPTILDAAGIQNPGGMDGRSLTSLLQGKKQGERDHIFTQYYMKIGQTNYQMRALQDTAFIYVFNPWHNGKAVYSTSSMGGSCFATMYQLGKTDPVWAKRSQYLLTRAPEECFDLRTDPHCLDNRIDDPTYAKQIADFKTRMGIHLKRSEDPMSEVFEVYDASKSVPKMVETYIAMWEKHGIPGRVAANPVKTDKWDDPEKAKAEKRAAKRKGNATKVKRGEKKSGKEN